MKKCIYVFVISFVLLLSGCVTNDVSSEELEEYEKKLEENLYASLYAQISDDIYAEIYDDVYADVYAEVMKNNTLSNDELMTIQTTIEKAVYDSVIENLDLDAIIKKTVSDQFYESIYADVVEKLEADITYTYDDLSSAVIRVVEQNNNSVFGVSNVYDGAIVSTGSGVVYKYDETEDLYYLVTNHHVIEEKDSEGVTTYEIEFQDGTQVPATLVGSDAQTDLAVLLFQGNNQDVTVAKIADDDDYTVGELVIAIGNPEGYTYYGSVTMGIISGTKRFIDAYDNENTEIDDDTIDLYTDYIQHDAAINPGNSGGALFNVEGELIGINVIKIVEEHVDEMGFAIPSDTVKKISADLEKDGVVIRPTIGIIFVDVKDIRVTDILPNNVTYGMYIQQVIVDSTVYGVLETGDVLLGMKTPDDTEFFEITSDDLLIQYFSQFEVGDVITIQYNRGGVVETADITLLPNPVD